MPLTLVLSVGMDSALLGVRKLLLQSAGYTVVSAVSISAAVERFLASDFDLVILCYSIPARDRDRLTCLIRASGSLTPVISVAGVEQNPLGSDNFASATVESQPLKLLAGIKDVLAQTHRRQTDYANPHRKRDESRNKLPVTQKS